MVVPLTKMGMLGEEEVSIVRRSRIPFYIVFEMFVSL